MNTDRFIILGVAHARSPWFATVAAWAAGGAAPLEFSKCLGVAEVEARLRAGQQVSAVLCDLGVSGVDRDLVALAKRHDAVVIAVGPPAGAVSGAALGAHADLLPTFSTVELLSTLQRVATPVSERQAPSVSSIGAERPAAVFAGHLVAVCARGGAGSSIVAMALAQALATERDSFGNVALVDWALSGDQGTYHDSPDVIPAVQELVEAHRMGTPTRAEGTALLRCVADRGYSLLLGLRQRHDWMALTPAAIEATCDSLRRWYRWTVADITAEFDDESTTGSFDIEERNGLARTAISHASMTLAVGSPTLKGLRDLVRLIDDLVRAGCDPLRILPVVNNAPRQRHLRSELTVALGTLGGTPSGLSPIFIGTRRNLESIIRCADPLPRSFAADIAQATLALCAELGPILESQDPVSVNSRKSA